jgi:lipoate-protein ligase A
MRLVEWFTNTPEEAIALDELLLVKAEAGRIGETLRLWHPREYFVVTGRAKRAGKDCFLSRCRQENIKIIRRISGGGTVLQGPGCLNYSVVLSYDRDGKYRDIRSSYRRILESVSGAFKAKGLGIEFLPISDLVLDGRKVSGNAQARKRKHFLHHGTFLFDFDIEKISRYLRHPLEEPEYRRQRAHEDFLTNVPVVPGQLEGLLKEVFLPSSDVWRPDRQDMEELDNMVQRKFSLDAWNFAF